MIHVRSSVLVDLTTAKQETIITFFSGLTFPPLNFELFHDLRPGSVVTSGRHISCQVLNLGFHLGNGLLIFYKERLEFSDLLLGDFIQLCGVLAIIRNFLGCETRLARE